MNYFIFEGISIDVHKICQKVNKWLVGSTQFTISRRLDKNRVSPSITLLAAWFDGASQRGICDYGMVIVLDIHSCHTLSWNGGQGNNTRVETMSLSGLLWFISKKWWQNINIYGDSKCLIGGILGLHTFDPPLFTGWVMRIKQKLSTLSLYSIQHVFWEFNMEVD